MNRIKNAILVLIGRIEVGEFEPVDYTNCKHRFGKWYIPGGCYQYRNCIDCNFEEALLRIE